jgi:hypothetical protein
MEPDDDQGDSITTPSDDAGDDLAGMLASVDDDLGHAMETIKKIRAGLSGDSEWALTTPRPRRIPPALKVFILLLPFIGVLVGFAMLAYYRQP